MMGVAIILPMYFYLWVMRPVDYMWGKVEHIRLPAGVSWQLVPTLFLGSVLPTVFAFWPGARMEDYEHHMWITVLAVFPLWIALVGGVFSFVPIQGKRVFGDVFWTYMFSAVLGVWLHWYVVGTAVMEPGVRVWRVFVPDLEADTFGGLVMLFLQFDHILPITALLVWAWMEFREVAEKGEGGLASAVWMMVGTVVLGPGTVVSLMWMVREKRLESLLVEKKI